MCKGVLVCQIVPRSVRTCKGVKECVRVSDGVCVSDGVLG